MSAVDVLAVLADLVADMGDAPGTTGHQVAQVRDAVAGLIEADKAYDATCDRAQLYPCPGMDEHVRAARKRRRAALARVQGGA